jgi:hypothetical protein
MSRGLRLSCLLLLVACGDGTGPALNPVPRLMAVTPAVVPSGSGPIQIQLMGLDFVKGAQVLIDGSPRPAALNVTTLLVQMDAATLAIPRVIAISVRNPAPGGGVSGSLELVVSDPAPVIDSVIPGYLMEGGAAATVQVVGQGFRATSVVRFNGTDRPTRQLSAQVLEADLTAQDLSVAARVQLAVVNPPLQGGAAQVNYPINHRAPVLGAMSPDHAPMGAAGTSITVTGSDFLPGASVTWNGVPRPTTRLGLDTLIAQIPGTDLRAGDSALIGVTNPDPAVGASASRWFRIDPRFTLPLVAFDLAWDSVRNRLYASTTTDEIVAIDPRTGQITARVTPGAGPSRMAISDDCSLLYVALDGEARVARIDLASFTVNLTFAVGTGAFGIESAGDLEVLPGSPRTVAVGKIVPAWRPAQDGVGLYDDGVERPLSMPRRVGGIPLEFASPTTLYGYDNETSGFELFRMDVTDSGLVLRDRTAGLVDDYGTDLRYGGGYLFSTLGTVVNTVTNLRAATLNRSGLVGTDPKNDRFYLMTHATLTAIRTGGAWDVIGSEPSPPGADPSWYAVTRWGEDGFAYIGPTQVVIFHSTLATR